MELLFYFDYEGSKRMKEGSCRRVRSIKSRHDNRSANQNLFKIASETATFESAFHLSNNVLRHGVQSVTDLVQDQERD